MAIEFKNVQVLLPNATAAEWEESTMIPEAGELILYTDLNKTKMGDGIHLPKELQFSDELIYFGTGEMPEGYDIQIDPDDELDMSILMGDSAYEIAQKNGFYGTEEEWLASLNGTDGVDGLWLDGLPDSAIICYDTFGNYKQAQYDYTFYLKQGNRSIDLANDVVSYSTTSNDISCNIAITDGVGYLTIVNSALVYPTDRVYDTIHIQIVTNGYSIAKTIVVNYTRDGEKGVDGTVAFDELTPEQQAALKGDPGVYVGSGDMPEDCYIQIDPEGVSDPYEIVQNAITSATEQEYDSSSRFPQSGVAVAQAIAAALENFINVEEEGQ